MKTTVFLVLLFFIPCLPALNREIMGMDYGIYADRETSCNDEFPEDLSFFFEQYGGYGEESEVAQVSTLLAIDLSAFQHYGSGTETEEEEQYWQNLQVFSATVAQFITKIQQKPAYYKSVKHGSTKTPSFQQIIQQQQQGKPINYYPPDRGYLSSGKLLQDLQKFKTVLDCFKKAGVKKIKLTYT